MPGIVTFLYPGKDINEPRPRRDLPHRTGLSLKYYLQELSLASVRHSCRMIRKGDRLPLRTSYVPVPGDVILMTKQR